MTPFLFLVTCLAAHRLTRLLTTDDIPFARIRHYLEQRWEMTIYAEGLTCPWCLGAYVSFALIVGLAQIISVPLPVLQALAVSSIVGIIARYTE